MGLVFELFELCHTVVFELIETGAHVIVPQRAICCGILPQPRMGWRQPGVLFLISLHFGETWA